MAVKPLPRQNVRSSNGIASSLIRQVFRSVRFLIGFIIFMAILLTVLIYPIVVKDPPLGIVSRGSFLPPGIYVNLYDSMNSSTRYTLLLYKAADRRVSV